MNDSRFRILCLDGGGIKGTYSAAVLAAIEEGTGKRIVDHFDLVAGTSTGGIIAIGLGLGVPAADLQRFYLEEGPHIFPSTRWLDRLKRTVRQTVAPKHDPEPLDSALRKILGARKLGESKCRLVIPAYDVVAGDIHVFKTAHDSRVASDHLRDAAEVARATSAAPTFLPQYSSTWGQRFVDGGLWANCPAAAAMIEATHVLGRRPEDIDLLSIGTTTPVESFVQEAQRGGAKDYILRISDLLMQAQAQGAWAQTVLMTNRRAMRIDARVAPGLYSIDDSRRIHDLVALGQRDARHNIGRVSEVFLQGHAPQFQPVKSASS